MAWFQLLHRSGFIYPAKAEYILKIGKDLLTTLKRLAHPASSEASKIFLARLNKQVVGTLSLTRFADHSWLIHQFATATEVRTSRVSLQLIDHVLTTLLLNPDARTAFVYFRDENTHARRFFGRMLERVGRTNSIGNFVDRLRFGLWEVPAPLVAQPVCSGRFSVSPITRPTELSHAESITLGNPLFDEALALGYGRFALEQTYAAYKACSLTRDRIVLSVGAGKDPLGFSLVEVFPQGLNLSGLLNCFRIFPRHDLDRNAQESVVLGLAAATARLCVSKGTPRPAALMPEQSYSLIPAGFVHARTYDQVVFDLRLARDHPEVLQAALPGVG